MNTAYGQERVSGSQGVYHVKVALCFEGKYVNFKHSKLCSMKLRSPEINKVKLMNELLILNKIKQKLYLFKSLKQLYRKVSFSL